METYINNDRRTDFYNNQSHDQFQKALLHKSLWEKAGFQTRIEITDDHNIIMLEVW